MIFSTTAVRAIVRLAAGALAAGALMLSLIKPAGADAQVVLKRVEGSDSANMAHVRYGAPFR